jgi:hypothetical protein
MKRFTSLSKYFADTCRLQALSKNNLVVPKECNIVVLSSNTSACLLEIHCSYSFYHVFSASASRNTQHARFWAQF